MVNLESLHVLLLSGCSDLEEIKGFPRNMRKVYLGGTAIREVPQLPKSLEFLNAHGCTHLKSGCLEFEQLPRHYTFSNCFNFSSQVIANFLEKALPRVARVQQQKLMKAPEVIICIPADARQRSSFLLQAASYVTIDLAPRTQKARSGFAMSVVVSFQDDYHNVVGLGIRCICTWKNSSKRYSEKTERLFRCWAPMEAPKVEWDHIFILYDAKMHEEIPKWADLLQTEFKTVSWENKLLGASCEVTQCGVEIVTAPTNDTIPSSEITRESEAINVVEEHDPTSSRAAIETKSPNILSSSEPRKVPSAHSKLKSKGTRFWKWLRLRTITRDKKKKKTLTDREQVELNPTSVIRRDRW